MKVPPDLKLIRERMQPGVISLRGFLGDDRRELRQIIEEDDAEVRRIGRTLELRLAPGVDPSRFLAAVAGLVRVKRFEVQAPSLHGIFVRLVSGQPRPAGPAPSKDPESATAGEAT